MYKDGLGQWTYFPTGPTQVLHSSVTISSPIVGTGSQVADLGSAYVLAPQSLGLPQMEDVYSRLVNQFLVVLLDRPIVAMLGV